MRIGRRSVLIGLGAVPVSARRGAADEGFIVAAASSLQTVLPELAAAFVAATVVPFQSELIFAALQVPGGEASALRLVAVSIFVALTALAVSEVMARRATRRVQGA